MMQAAARTGRDVGTDVLFMVIAEPLMATRRDRLC
jgi:hypothetical protein